MADECELEELTAFLEASEDEEQNKEVKEESDKPDTGDKTKAKPIDSKKVDNKTEDDECNLEDIEAFLQASDDEDDDDNVESETKENEEREEPAKVIEKSKSIQEEMDFEDFEEGDFQELEEMMDSQDTETSQGKTANQLEQNANTTQSEGENEEISRKVTKESDCEDGTDGDDSGSDSENLAHELIEAEMAAMAKRMKELKSLLKKSKSSPESCKKKSKTSPESEKNKHKSHSNGKSRTSPKSQNTDSLGKKHSHSKIDSDKSLKTDKQSSSDLLKRQIDKHKALLEAKGKKSKIDRHFSNIAAGSSQSSSPGSKSKEKESLKLKQNLKKETDDDGNPFFARSRDPCEQSGSRPATSCNKKGNTADEPVDSKTLFGDSDDSDWDDLAGEEKSKLSKEGKELKKLINSGHKTRQAHMPNYDPAVLKKPNISRWTETNSKPLRIHPIQQVSQKPALDPVTGTVSGKYKVKDEYMQKSTITKEDVRESVTDPFCGIRIINPRVPMDVFKRKMEGRNLVKISRLVSKMGTDLQKDNWVTLGVVVHKTEPRQSAAGKAYCIWKLSDLQNCDKTVTFFLFGNVYKEHWKNDLGVVIGLLNPSIMDKAEKNQAELAITINHPQQLLMMGISKDLGRCRGTTKAGSPCSSFINKMQGEFCTYHVQSAYRKSSSKRTELQASTGITPKAFTQQKNKNAGSGCFFYGGNTYTTQKPQAKSSKDKMTLNKLQSFEAKKAPGKITTLSLHDLEPDDEKKIDKLRQKDKDLLQLLSVPSAGSMNFVKHLVKKDANPTVNKIDEGDIVPSASAKDLLKQHSKTLLQKKKEVELLTSTPTLGKGIGFGQEISLDAPINKGKGKASAELAKRLAIAKIKSKGGVNKEDPNSVRKKITSPEAREKIRKRVAEDMEDDNTGDSSSKEPPQKKSKLLGDLDLNSPDVQQLLKKKSKHKGALAEAESEQEERYFSALEKKEQMEDKMGTIMEVPVKLFMCLQCNYRYFSIHERCKKENHPTKQVKGVKRFFKCKHCKRRTVSIDRLPTKPCKDCGSSNWERVSMLKERNGPKLESEELCLRGNEQKFIGSLQGKASFNG